NFLFTSNHSDAFYVSFSDRRFFIHAAPERQLMEVWGKQKIDAYAAWRDSGAGREALRYHLLHWKIASDWDHRSPPDTALKAQMQSGSANKAENWLRDIDANPVTLSHLEGRRFWTAEELLALFQLRTRDQGYTVVGMGKALAAAQWCRLYHGQQIRGLTI